MLRADVFRTSTFRTAILASAIFVGGTLLLLAFIYWQTAGYEAKRIDDFITHEASAMAREPAQSVERDVTVRFARDLHRLTFAGVFSSGHRALAGELAEYPGGLPADRKPHVLDVLRQDKGVTMTERVSVIAWPLSDGRILVVGRSRQDLQHLRVLVGGALGWSLIPGLLLALSCGAWASYRSMSRVAAFHRSLDRIIDGGLRERLPDLGTRDTIDMLAVSVNRTLERMEHLLDEVRGVGDSIAHDLRTPLTRMRMRLEGGRRRAVSLAEMDHTVVQAIADLDRCLLTITALLRIGELESAQRRVGFGDVSISAIVAEVGDLYQPLAELRGLHFDVVTAEALTVHGDRDLLFELCANLVDNAIKFAPEHGGVSLTLLAGSDGPVLRIADTGLGIAADERGAVLTRFYRSSRTSGAPGSGLGLSLVAAILRLHGFALAMRDLTPGFAVDVIFSSTTSLPT